MQGVGLVLRVQSDFQITVQYHLNGVSMIVQQPARLLQIGGRSQERQGGSVQPGPRPLATRGSFGPDGYNEPGVSNGAHDSVPVVFE